VVFVCWRESGGGGEEEQTTSNAAKREPKNDFAAERGKKREGEAWTGR